MIVIFDIEKDTLNFEQKVHDFLLENRKDYNADRWGVSQIDTINNLWGVKLPSDYKELGFDVKGLKLAENDCISYKFFDIKTNIEATLIKETIQIAGKTTSFKTVETTKYYIAGKEVSPFELTAKTILTAKK